MRIAFCRGVACARLSDSIRSGNVLKAKLRRARLGKGAARFSHFLLLNDFPPLSRSLEQAIIWAECYTSSSLLVFFAKLLHAKPKVKRANNLVVCSRAG